ncbi:hypothetical protein U5N28_03225 [Lysinibacillus telephonicus]|uniref:hypothetical protein n=1 Tax=Lysinibacillus telephonicus TaxID=1714840 RepID=UPI0031FC6E29
MGRDDSKGKSNNRSSLPQTPKSQKIAPNRMKEEMAEEIEELHLLVEKAKNNTNANK